jgi:geranylgeranylglycerol-phosphate geranylgeranyltransferase
MYALTAFGFQINDVLDYRKDRAAGVERPIAAGALSLTDAMAFALVLLALTCVLSAWIGAGGKVLAATALALILYTPTARGFPPLKGLYVAVLCVSPLIYGAAVRGAAYAWQPYAFVIAFIAAREALMDSNELEGDRRAGMKTIAMLLGKTQTRKFAAWVMALSMAVLAAVSSGGIAKAAATAALVMLLCVFFWPRLEDGRRIALTRIPMLAAAVALACG